MSHPNQPSQKGKEVIIEHGTSKRSRTSYVPRPPTGFFIHEPSNTPVISSSDEEEGHIEFRTPYTTEFQSNLTYTPILQGEGSNGSKHVNHVVGSSATVMPDQRQQIANISEDKNRARRERDRARRNSLTAEQKEEINARRRAARQSKALTAKQKEDINARRRAAQQNKKEEINAHRKVARQNKALEERNARQRANRKNLSVEERQKESARRMQSRQNIAPEVNREMNANRRARRQSIPENERQALLAKRKANAVARRNTPCADSIALPCPIVASLATLRLAKEGATSPPVSPSRSTPDYIIGTEDDMEGFLRSLMDENAFRDDLMDEENDDEDLMKVMVRSRKAERTINRSHWRGGASCYIQASNRR